MILNKLFFLNQSKQHPILSILLATRRLYNTMQHANEDTNDYLLRFHHYQKVNEVCNGILITREFHEHGIKIPYLLHSTGFYTLLEDEKKEAKKPREEMLSEIIYLENSDKARFSELKKRVDNE